MKSVFIFTLALIAASVSANAFSGWQGLRVIKSSNGTYKMIPINDGEGAGQTLMLVETRQSRLSFYRYVGKGEDTEDFNFLENPNYLPMAEDFERTEHLLKRLPQVASVQDIDGDGIDEIFLVQTDPRKLVVLKKEADGWESIKEWEIADSDLSTSSPVLVCPVGDQWQIFISFKDGIQVIDYATSSEVNWLQPRERDIERNRWWLSDFDEDGDIDIVEAQNSVSSPLRWYESEGSIFRPAVNISEDINNTNVARLIRSSEGPRVAFLGANQANTISYYELGQGEDSEYGRLNLLPINQASSANWAAIELDGKKAIVELGRNKPLLKVYEQQGTFWQFKKSYPVLQDVEGMKAVRNARNSILFWMKDDGQMYESHWDSERFTFPQKIDSGELDTSDWKIIAFDQYESQTWWVQQRDKELVLNIWEQASDQIRTVVFPNVKGEYEESVWLGGEAMLVKKKFAKNADLCRLVDGETVITSSRFKAADIQKIRYDEGSLYIAEDGVVQKLAENLEVQDQIMLEGDYSIRSFAPISNTQAYALEAGGERLHFMEADESGIFQTVERYKIPYSLNIVSDPVLGLTFVGSSSINVPSEGSSEQLELLVTVDPNEGNNRDYDKKAIGTMFVVDVNGDGIDELATVDYGSKNIVIYEESNGGYEELISWKVYDDGKYPYGQNPGQRANINPYRMLSMDIDGDSQQDLILASHDRIIIYLAKESDS